MPETGQTQWTRKESAVNYTHPLDIQFFNDRPMLRMLGTVVYRDVLDVGCGNGILTRTLAEQGARRVVGVDYSTDMIRQAKAHPDNSGNMKFYAVANANRLPVPNESFDSAISSLTINNFPTADMVRDSFEQVARALKNGGTYVISLPHPHTLDKRTSYRWTEWENGQNQNNLISGEGFRRKIMGADGKMISITNYYWSREVLQQLAERAGLQCVETVEALATEQDLRDNPNQIEQIMTETPFFLVMKFIKQEAKTS